MEILAASKQNFWWAKCKFSEIKLVRNYLVSCGSMAYAWTVLDVEESSLCLEINNNCRNKSHQLLQCRINLNICFLKLSKLLRIMRNCHNTELQTCFFFSWKVILFQLQSCLYYKNRIIIIPLLIQKDCI